ncbi:hypothetical protein CSUB01_11414 [Colletotrichum sublineola]|uniref:Uncharacterized protein n=1 Tax=Colletotrichum sublineola TaxID=1173701 RepID=A0A066XSA1_COLSU|nr:hypothetical protein CSUB01_11414 [Colletotrichum sublineola]
MSSPAAPDQQSSQSSSSLLSTCQSANRLCFPAAALFLFNQQLSFVMGKIKKKWCWLMQSLLGRLLCVVSREEKEPEEYARNDGPDEIVEWVAPAHERSNHPGRLYRTFVLLVYHEEVRGSRAWAEGFLAVVQHPGELLNGDEDLAQPSVEHGFAGVKASGKADRWLPGCRGYVVASCVARDGAHGRSSSSISSEAARLLE